MSISRLIPLLLIFSLAFTSVGCKSWRYNHKRKRDAKEIERKERKQQAEAAAKYEKAMKHHASIQTPDTRRKMKRKFKQSDNYTHNKKEFFLKRWFTPKKRRTTRVSPE